MWSGLHISPEGYITLCGVSKERLLDFIPPHIDEIENLQDFFNSDYFINYRETKVSDNKFCVACITREKNGMESTRSMLPRAYALNNISKAIEINKCRLEHLDICFNNLCNQQCIMCKSEYSSKWYLADKKHENTEFHRKAVKYKKWTSEKNMKKIFDVLPNLKLLTIKGGEPLIQEEVKRVLYHLNKLGISTKVEILSNFQEVSEEMMDILHNLKNFSLRISLDSSKSMYNWTRGGNWNKTIENIKTYAKGCKYPTDISYTNTLNRWSYKYLIDDIKEVEATNREFCDSHNNYNIFLVIGPRYTSPFAAPIEERKQFIFDFEKEYGFIISDSIKYKSLKINHLNNIIALENDPLNSIDDLLFLSDQWAEIVNKVRIK